MGGPHSPADGGRGLGEAELTGPRLDGRSLVGGLDPYADGPRPMWPQMAGKPSRAEASMLMKGRRTGAAIQAAIEVGQSIGDATPVIDA